MKKETKNMVFKELFGIELNTPISGWIVLEEKLSETPSLFYQSKERFDEIMKFIRKAIKIENKKR